MDLFGLTNLSVNTIFIQGIGFLAFFAGIYAFANKNDYKLRRWQAVQCYFLSLHFYLLGAQSASAIALLAGIRNSIALYRSVSSIAIIFLVLYVVIGILGYKHPVDILPICSALLGTTAIFYLKWIKMRVCMMVGTLLWIIHNAIVLSVGPFFMELIIFCVTAHTTYTLWKYPKNELR